MYFLPTPEVFFYYPNHKEKEFRLQMIGYHNFKFISSEYFERQQPCYTFHFIISGKGILKLNGKQYNVGPYDIFYLDNKCKFSYFADDKQPWEYIFFELDGNFADTYAQIVGLNYDNPIKQCINPQKILSQLIDIFQSTDSQPSYFLVSSLFFSLLDSVYIENKLNSNSHSQKIVNDAKELIELKYFQSTFNLNFLCKAIHVSHSHFCRIFKKKEGITPIQYINNVKMQHAKELLLKTDKSVYEISLSVGYNEYDHFLKLFKKIYNVTPSNYREKHRKDVGTVTK